MDGGKGMAVGIWTEIRLRSLRFSFHKIKTNSSHLASWSRGKMDDVAHVQQMLQEYGALPPVLDSLSTDLVGTPRPGSEFRQSVPRRSEEDGAAARQPLFRSEARVSIATRVQEAWVVGRWGMNPLLAQG